MREIIRHTTFTEFKGLPMDQFDGLWIIRSDKSEVCFNDVVKGFIQHEGEPLECALLRAAKEADPTTSSIHFKG